MFIWTMGDAVALGFFGFSTAALALVWLHWVIQRGLRRIRNSLRNFWSRRHG